MSTDDWGSDLADRAKRAQQAVNDLGAGQRAVECPRCGGLFPPDPKHPGYAALHDCVDPNTETYQNELVAAGGVWAALGGHGVVDRIEMVSDEAGQPTTAMWVWLSFLRSRYRVTVTFDPEPTWKGGRDG